MPQMPARGLVRSMAIIGSASVVNVLIGVARVKIIALLLGPAGIGLLGILVNIYEAGRQLSGLGLEISGVRQIATSSGDPAELARVRSVLMGASLIQGAIGMATIWLLRERLALWIIGDTDHAALVGLVGVAVLIGLISGAHVAILQGVRRIGDIARVTIFGAALFTLCSVLAVWRFGENGLIAVVLLQPLASLGLAWRYVRRLPRPVTAPLSRADILRHWRVMAGVGVALMAGAVLLMLNLLIIRSMTTRVLGIEATGHFQASWAISIQYIGFILGAMTADYYPRLSALIHDRRAAIGLVNDQIQIAVALGGPVLLVLLGAAPWVIVLLYSAEFTPTVSALQWQCLGNVMKLASWAMGFILVAQGRSVLMFATTLLWNALFLGFVWWLLPGMGIEAIGLGFTICYGFQLMLASWLSKRLLGFVWDRLSVVLVATHLALSGALLALAMAAPVAGAVCGVAAGAITGLWGLRIVAHKVGSGGRAVGVVETAFRRIGWPIRR